jgi:hypothetical protein
LRRTRDSRNRNDQQISTSEKQNLLDKFPLGRFETVNEVAIAVSYFVMEESAFTTGSVLDVKAVYSRVKSDIYPNKKL